MACVFVVYLVPPRFQFCSRVFVSLGMIRVVVLNRRVAIEAERHGIVDMRTLFIEMGDFDADPHELPTKAAVTLTPQEHPQFVGFLEIVLASGHGNPPGRRVTRCFAFYASWCGCSSIRWESASKG